MVMLKLEIPFDQKYCESLLLMLESEAQLINIQPLLDFGLKTQNCPMKCIIRHDYYI